MFAFFMPQTLTLMRIAGKLFFWGGCVKIVFRYARAVYQMRELCYA